MNKSKTIFTLLLFIVIILTFLGAIQRLADIRSEEWHQFDRASEAREFMRECRDRGKTTIARIDDVGDYKVRCNRYD